MCDKTIAIMMTVYNEEPQWLHECMQSILAQTYTNIHLYVLLDKPDNLEAKNILDDYAQKDERVSVYVNEQNLGLVLSLNKLLGFVSEDLIARMDADDVMVPERFERELAFMKEYDLDFVMSGCSFLYADGSTGKGADIPLLVGDSYAEVEKHGNVSLHNTWLMKREVYDKLKGYRLVRHCEDYDFVLRAIQAGYKLGRLNEELAAYRLRDTSVSAMYAKEQFEKSRFLRYHYSKGNLIEKLSPEKLNDIFSSYSSEEQNQFAKAKSDIDVFCNKLYEGKLAKASLDACRMLVRGKESRKLFVNSMWNNRKLAKVYRSSKS